MVHIIKYLGVFMIATFMVTACTKESDLLISSDLAPAREAAFSNQVTLTSSPVSEAVALNDVAARSKTLAIWADCEGFATIGTPTSFKPTAGNFDELYNIGPAGGAFKNGLGAISESKPGDRDFNGGRWHVNVPKEGVDLSKYAGACSVEDLDLNDFQSTTTYFECPLLPVRGNGHD